MLNRYRKLRGGYKFRKQEGVFSRDVEEARIPTRVTIPLKLRFGSKITPLVKKGQRVRAGEIIAREDDNISTPAIASVNGVVEDILPINYFYGKVDAVVIKSDGTKDWVSLKEAAADYAKLSFEKISELIYVSGAASLSKSGIPTIFKSSPARPKSIKDIIITTFRSAPFSLDEKILFKAREKDFYHGLAILKRAIPNAKATIAMDKNDKVFKRYMIDAIRRGSHSPAVPDWMFIQELDNRYPQESEDMLVRTVLKKKILIGGLGVDIGVLLLDIHDVLGVYDAVALGKPLIERAVAISGSACKENKYISLRIGVSLEEAIRRNIKDGVEPRAIFGNAMTGIMQKDLSMPVGRSIDTITVLAQKTDREFLAFMRPGLKSESYSRAFLSSYISSKMECDTNMHGELRACIQCGYCQDVCPVDIIPHLLSKQIKHDVCEAGERLGIFECIDCGLCSYVCPCKIPLADDIMAGKKKLIEEGCNVPRVKVKESEEAVKAYRGRTP